MKSLSRFTLTPDRLPPRCRLVLDTLRQSPLPLTAYGVLERCRNHGLNTPIQVYRILDRLIACQGCHASGRDALFAICEVCEVCGCVAEVEAAEVLTCAGRQAVAHGFAPSRIGVEILGRCQACTPQDG
jgi:Fur family zinc uptake transcriptional regulator